MGGAYIPNKPLKDQLRRGLGELEALMECYRQQNTVSDR